MKDWTSSNAVMNRSRRCTTKVCFVIARLNPIPLRILKITLANTASSMLTLILGGRHQHQGLKLASIGFVRAIILDRAGGAITICRRITAARRRHRLEERPGIRSFHRSPAICCRSKLGRNWPIAGGSERNYGAAYSTSLGDSGFDSGVSVVADLPAVDICGVTMNAASGQCLRFTSRTGQPHDSLGQRPRKAVTSIPSPQRGGTYTRQIGV